MTEEIEKKKRDKAGSQARVRIDAAVVKAQAALAAEAVAGDVRIYDTNDSTQPYLTLRRCGRRLSWLIRAYKMTKVIGAANSPRNVGSVYLGVSAAREKAKEAYEALRLVAAGKASAAPVPPVVEAPRAAWTWADLDREYQASLKESRWVGGATGREKPPSQGTQDDVRLMFAKPTIATMGPKLVTDLMPEDLLVAVAGVHAQSGYRVCCKALAYVKAALTWALSDRGVDSGMLRARVLPWWPTIKPPKPTAPEIKKIVARRSALAEAKVNFTIDHLAALLVAHEAHCVGRIGEEKVSPGIRWGLWWVAMTANRRTSTVAFERKRLLQVDKFGRPGWGLGSWPIEDMKGRSEFWLPLPPDVLHIANSGIQDWTSLVMRSTGAGALQSAWVFASTRRIGRDPENEDVAVYPNSLNHHLRVLRGQKKGHENKLGDMPWFSLHLARSVMGNYLDNVTGVPKSAISAMLAHADGDSDDRLAATTRTFYVQNQRMELKAIAMQAWSEALRTAYEKKGGRWPEPSEPPVNPLLMAS